ncbi:MAG: polyribonucleotide nucleotidyltransferase [Microgenomates group bacterium]
MKPASFSIEIGGKQLILEVGRLAPQANASVLGRLGDTVVLSTVVSGSSNEEVDYFPLQVEYIERLYAGGKIKGSRWVKREGRPSDEAVLTARLVDRSIRPLFPKGYRNEVQVMITVLSVDAENNPDIPAICATSAALAISDIPWEGPIGALRVGFIPKNGKGFLIANPTYQDLEYSELDLVVAFDKKAVVMLEGGGKEIPEEVFLQAVSFAKKEGEKIIHLIEEIRKKLGKKKQVFSPLIPDKKLVAEIKEDYGKKIKEILLQAGKDKESLAFLEEIKKVLEEKYSGEKENFLSLAVDEVVKEIIREKVLKEKKRIDGRGLKEIRPIEIEVGVLPRTHGSAIFRRGNTHVLTVTTLGSPSLEQLIESMEGEETKRYIHHYYMPPYSVGETGKIGWPSRREIGHGALAEKALEPVIPSEEKFPYTIRVVSEVMSSNGSTSMASVCGSTLSLMDAGVPIKAPVAGIALGKIEKLILSDIIGLEDFNGDMDFKVAGTEKGITAVQLDVKSLDFDEKLLAEALIQAKEGRLFILEKMKEVLPAPRFQISKFAPKVEVIKVPEEKIGEIIGPGGKTIRRIISETGANVEIDDEGKVNISALDQQAVDKAVAWIKGLIREAKVGDVFIGTVKRIQPFGVFVEILPGKEGLVHVSQMAAGFVSNPAKLVKVGQKVKVRVIEIDELGRINLSMKFPPKRR